MKTLPHRLRHTHIPFRATWARDPKLDLDMHGGDDLRVRELPDVHVVTRYNTRDRLDVLLYIINIQMIGRGLEEDLCSRRGQRNGGTKDDEGDEEGDCWVGVEALWGVGEPDDER